MIISHSFFRAERNKAILSIVAVLLCVLPNLVQDVHRLTGHTDHVFTILIENEQRLHHQGEKCPVCKFEFNAADEIESELYSVVLSKNDIILCENIDHQIAIKIFDYSQLRAPPVS